MSVQPLRKYDSDFKRNAVQLTEIHLSENDRL